ncbi:exosortase-associated EpsI family protein [Anaerobaca lacustris]|uniref:Exosortase-associated EpsI family protein n=1 Tax=Anaerobaca lacustris TaxID=3044600 RepID=A0AAW6U821_9BACT|nr:exosortase-associated EpsI family protein [Sedimentisphaerales bacterium M17dextr]
MVSNSPNHKPVVIAAIIAGCVMLGVGMAYRVLAGDVWTAGDTIAVDPAVLERLPMRIGDWEGQNVAMDERVMQATGGDTHITRQYLRKNDGGSVSLYIVAGTNGDAVMDHNPEVCYVRGGWVLTGRCPEDLQLNDGTVLPVICYHFQRDGLAGNRIVVLHYCYAMEQYFSRVVEVFSDRWRGLQRIGFAAQVQIIASSQTLTDDAAIRLVTDFAVDSSAVIAELLARIEDERTSHQSEL